MKLKVFLSKSPYKKFNEILDITKSIKLFSFVVLLMLTFNVWAKRPEYVLELKDNLFYPETIHIPAGQKVKLIIYNRDDSVEEFDSFDLNREKVLYPNQKAVIYIGPLPEGTYQFFGEFHPYSAKGTVIITSPGGKNAN
ncbi:MAG: hypothetical protein COB83_09175 [Gammaproteobacteria bacterium]|nr:MAG: hypothetical protein COB83_09175 [Gammaproteobacteria bacterium]